MSTAPQKAAGAERQNTRDQAVVLVITNGGGGQSTLPDNQGHQRSAGHGIMQDGGSGGNISCEVPGARAAEAT